MGYREALDESNRSDKDPVAQLACLALIVGTFWYALTDKGQEVLINSTKWNTSSIDWCEDNYVYTPHVSNLHTFLLLLLHSHPFSFHCIGAAT